MIDLEGQSRDYDDAVAWHMLRPICTLLSMIDRIMRMTSVGVCHAPESVLHHRLGIEWED
jgi:hypothetical protein